jgi:single-stranded-DNA-specific exonuclease
MTRNFKLETRNFKLQIEMTTPNVELAASAFAGFVARLDRKARAVALHDSDADGVTAAVVWLKAFTRLGFENVVRVVPDRDRNAWSQTNRQKVKDAGPSSLFVLDLGSRGEQLVEGVETCLIDHHRPEGVPPGAILISAYGWDPIPNTSLLVWELCSRLVDINDLDWVAAIGAISDLGEHAPFDLLASAKGRYKARYLKEATTLVNAARRASLYDPETAARALLEHDSPRALVESTSPDVEQLRIARSEVKIELDEAKKAAPVFSGKVALVRVNSPCQVHPLIAQIWRSRLPKYIVLVANEGYMPGRINFSARSAQGINVLDFLRAIRLSEGEGDYGRGHDQASGGSLSVERWNELLKMLGFPDSALAR